MALTLFGMLKPWSICCGVGDYQTFGQATAIGAAMVASSDSRAFSFSHIGFYLLNPFHFFNRKFFANALTKKGIRVFSCV